MDPHFDGVIFKTHAEELHRRMNHAHPPFAVLDVRPDGEQSSGSIPGAAAASLASLETGLPEGTDTHTEFYVVGRDIEDGTAREVSLKLRGLGAVRVVELPGGVREWQNAGFGLG